MKAGDKVRVHMDMEAELAYVYSDHYPYPIVDVREEGSTVLWTVPLSAVTPVIVPEVGDIWERYGTEYMIVQRLSGLKAVVLCTDVQPPPWLFVQEFMLTKPAPTLKYRQGHTP